MQAEQKFSLAGFTVRTFWDCLNTVERLHFSHSLSAFWVFLASADATISSFERWFGHWLPWQRQKLWSFWVSPTIFSILASLNELLFPQALDRSLDTCHSSTEEGCVEERPLSRHVFKDAGTERTETMDQVNSSEQNDYGQKVLKRHDVAPRRSVGRARVPLRDAAVQSVLAAAARSLSPTRGPLLLITSSLSSHFLSFLSAVPSNKTSW